MPTCYPFELPSPPEYKADSRSLLRCVATETTMGSDGGEKFLPWVAALSQADCTWVYLQSLRLLAF
jgi:hypothetical protein